MVVGPRPGFAGTFTSVLRLLAKAAALTAVKLLPHRCQLDDGDACLRHSANTSSCLYVASQGLCLP